MKPIVLYYPAWDVLWALAALAGIAYNFRALRRLGIPVAAVLLLLAALPVATLAGAKALFVAESGWVEGWRSARGFRGPGGLVAAATTLVALCWWLGIPIRRTLDAIAPSFVLVIAVGRLGCFLAGCCFGTPTELPWGIAFPGGSPAHASHVAQHVAAESALTSLPVHPLSLYFSVEALAILAFLCWLTPRAQYEGQVSLSFAVLHFWSKAGLETLRGADVGGQVNRSGEVALWIAIAASAVLLAVTVVRRAERGSAVGTVS